MKKQYLIRAASIIFLFALGGYLADIAVRIFLGKKFGASHELDAYLLATSLPSWIIAILTTTLSRSYIPLSVDLRKQGSDQGKETIKTFTTRIFLLLTIGLAIFTIVVVAVMPFVSPFVFGVQAEDMKSMTIQLGQLAFPSVLGAGIVSLLIGTLYIKQKFFAASLILFMQKMTAAVGLIFFVPEFGISAAAGALTVSWLIAALALVVYAKKEQAIGFMAQADDQNSRNANSAFIRQFFSLSFFLVVGALLAKSLFFIEPFLASFLGVGSVTAITYSKNIIMLPLGLISATFATALFPSQSFESVQQNHDALKKSLLTGLRATAFLTFPFIVGASIASVPLARLLFERGQFTHDATAETAQTFVYALGFLLGSGASVIFMNVLYAMRDTSAIIRFGLVTTAANIALDLVLMRVMGVEGIALAGSIVAVASIGYVVFILAKKQVSFAWQDALPFVKMLVAFVISYGLTRMGFGIVQEQNDFIQLLSVFFVATLVYVIASSLLGLREWEEVLRLIKKRKQAGVIES